MLILSMIVRASCHALYGCMILYLYAIDVV